MQDRFERSNHLKHSTVSVTRVHLRGQGGVPDSAASPVQQSDRPAADGWRFSVRLETDLARWVRNRSDEVGSTPSDLVRAAIRGARSQAERMTAILAQSKGLDATARQKAQPAALEPHNAQTAAGVPITPSSGVPRFPRALWAVVKQMRDFGATAWSERRRRFGQLVALVQICIETSRERQDGELLADLLRLGAKYGLLLSDTEEHDF